LSELRDLAVRAPWLDGRVTAGASAAQQKTQSASRRNDGSRSRDCPVDTRPLRRAGHAGRTPWRRILDPEIIQLTACYHRLVRMWAQP